MKQAKFEKMFYSAAETALTLTNVNACNIHACVGLAVDAQRVFEPIERVLKQQLSAKVLRFLKSEARRLYFVLLVLPIRAREEILNNILIGKMDAVEDEKQDVEDERKDVPQILASAFRVPGLRLIEIPRIGLSGLDYVTFVLNLVHGYRPSIRSTSELGHSSQGKMFYIVIGRGDMVRYLHSDGSLLMAITEKNGAFGYFASREAANEAIRNSIERGHDR